MNKEKIISMLHELDGHLSKDGVRLEIAVCGASALLLQGSILRETTDIDLIKASSVLNNKEVKEAISMVGINNRESIAWLNNEAEEYLSLHIPKTYKPEVIRMEKSLKNINLYCISNPDIVITKLADTDNMRRHDFVDIEKMKLSEKDAESVYKKISEIGKESPIQALKMEINFKRCRPEYIKTNEGFGFTNVDELQQYAISRHGLRLSDSNIEEMKENIQNGHPSIKDIVLSIDKLGLAKLEAKKDKNYDMGL
jgi:hypothetical protein